ncbi:hypothetical protein Plhal304r1_c028g0093521 [Plasmopara halstedii]
MRSVLALGMDQISPTLTRLSLSKKAMPAPLFRPPKSCHRSRLKWRLTGQVGEFP